MWKSREGQEEGLNLEYPWNLLRLSSVHVSLSDWSHMEQFAGQEGTKLAMTYQTHLYIYPPATGYLWINRNETTLTRYLVPLRGWTVPYPAHHCRTESSYCSPPRTASIERTMRGKRILPWRGWQRSQQTITDFKTIQAHRGNAR